MTQSTVPVDHTALYLGSGEMLHAFPAKGVVVEEPEPYRSVLVCARP